MKQLYFLFLICFLISCNKKINDSKILIFSKTSNHLLRSELKNKKFISKVFKNDIVESKSDSVIVVYFNKPFKQGYEIDSIYFLDLTDSKLKILAQNEIGKGLIYLEGDTSGFHMILDQFGGYVTNVSNIEIKNKKSEMEINFSYYVWGMGMPKPEPQRSKITTKVNKIDFKAYWIDANNKEELIPEDWYK